MRRWELWQAERLAVERMHLRQWMPDFVITEPMGDTSVSGNWVSNKGQLYSIRISLPPGYPDVCPSTYIEWPYPLLDVTHRPMTTHGTSTAHHTWETDRPGIPRICTFRPEYWDASNTIIQMLIKAFLWITAYEVHIDTGRLIQDILLEME